MASARFRNGRDPKGFVLLIVLVVGVAAALAAAALWSTSGHSRLTAMHTDITDRSGAIAEAGMQAALAYLKKHEEDNRDFDAILDPDLSCDSLYDTPQADDLVPDLGGGSVTFRAKSWHMVEFNGGGFLVRFEDDADDSWPVGRLWQRATGNNEDSGGGSGEGGECFEGPRPSDSGTGNHADGRDNPLRDRNGTIWVHVLGFYPGDDPARATHFASTRRIYSFEIGQTSVPGIRVKGDIELTSAAGTMGLCSPIGSIEVDGEADKHHNGSACASGDSIADDWDDWESCAESEDIDCEAVVTAPEGEYQLPGAVAGSLTTPGPVVPDVPQLDGDADQLIDWSRPCVFQIREDNLYFWDANRVVGGATCGEQAEGSLDNIPTPVPGGGYPGGCWSPILINANGACRGPTFVVGASAVSEVSTSTGSCGWAPRAVSATLDPASLPALGYPSSLSLTKPNWQTECTIEYPPFAESPASLGCTSCTATNTANVALHSTGSNRPWMFFPVRNAADAAAVPAGVYLFDTDIRLSGQPPAFAMSAHPLADDDALPMDDYILATVATTGHIDLQNPTGGGKGGYFFGAGQNHEGGDDPLYRMPSLIADNDVEVRGAGTMAVAGTIITRGHIDYAGTGKMFLFGEAHIQGDFRVTGNGEFWWLYQVPLQPTSLAGRVFPPVSGPILR